MKRIVPFLFALTLCHAGTAAQAAAPAFGKQPNIILIITDDQGYYDLSSHGNPHLATPNIDKLRGESLRFRRVRQPVRPSCRAGRLFTSE